MMEKHLTVAIQGIRGSYHHVAVEKYFGVETDFVECVHFKQVPEAIEEGPGRLRSDGHRKFDRRIAPAEPQVVGIARAEDHR